MHACEAFDRCCALAGVYTVLDVGAGNGVHTKRFKEAGKKVYSIDHQAGSSVTERAMYPVDTGRQYDLVWCSHTLEHAHNVQLFIEQLVRDTKPGGYLCVTVPPLKKEIVGGHVNLFNAGLLLYRLVLGGIDCSKASVLTYGYNVSVLVQRDVMVEAVLHAVLRSELKHDNGDIDLLSAWLPNGYNRQGFNGEIAAHNW